MQPVIQNAGRFHFFNPMNYFKNLADFNQQGMFVLKHSGDSYRTFPDFVPDVILGLAFGNGDCNYDIAKAMNAAQLHFQRKPFLIAQEEVAMCYSRLFKADIASIKSSPSDGKYRTSREIFRSAREDHLYTRPESFKKIMFAAHPAHVERVLVTASQEGLEGVPLMPKEVQWNYKDVHYWTNSPLNWVARELIVGRTAGSFL